MALILIVDDSPTEVHVFQKALERHGYKTATATDGVEGVRMAKEIRPDLIFMDIVMPGKTGIQALSEIRAHDPSARVVMASSTGTSKNLKAAIDSGAADFIQKPFEREAVLKLIRRILEGEWE